jgi:carbamoyl-phosphate synthase large subunit
MGKVNVGVTGTGSLIGQAVIKSIRFSELLDRVNLVGMDYFPGTVGSRWTDASYLLPDILKDEVTEAVWLKELTRIIETEQLHYIFVGVDFELPILAANREKLREETGCTVVVSDPEVIRIGNDKYKTYQFLVEQGIPAPGTCLYKDYQTGMIPLPCIVKPAVGARSRGVSIVSTEEELRSAAEAISNPIVQELIGNSDSEYTCGAICLDGEVKEVIALRRSLREGNTADALYEGKRPCIDEYVARIAECLKPTGACNFQLRLDDDGNPKLFEINPRHSGTTFMRALFGFNEVEYILKRLMGESVPAFRLKTGLVKRYYEEMYYEQADA